MSNKKDKQTVYYKEAYGIKIGNGAFVSPIDHTSKYVTNSGIARTTRVISYDKSTGVFETENSVYKPENLNED